MTRIAIIGRTEFLYEITKFLIHNQYNISIIITSKSEKHYQIKECDYKKLAKDNNVDFIFTNKNKKREDCNLVFKGHLGCLGRATHQSDPRTSTSEPTTKQPTIRN